MPAVLYLMFGVPAFVVTYVVLYWFITRNGNSVMWVLLPLASVLLLVLRAVAVGQIGGNAAASSDTFGLVIAGIWLACFTGWLVLLVAGCVRWSEIREARRRSYGRG
jgi:hypothetical protein